MDSSTENTIFSLNRNINYLLVYYSKVIVILTDPFMSIFYYFIVIDYFLYDDGLPNLDL